MKCVLAVAVLFAAGSSGAGAARAVSNSPLERVVNLLKDLEERITADGKSEEKQYNKYACWCKEATETKADAIHAAEEQLREVGANILKSKGEVATLAAEIKELEEKMEANLKEQDEQTSIRNERNQAYVGLTAETKQAMVAMEKAIDVLVIGASGEPKDAALLQQTAGRSLVRRAVESMPANAAVDAKHLSLLGEYLDGKAGYTPQSATVQGILKDMYATFASDVESATLKEADQNREFESFIAASIEEYNKDKASKEKKEGLKADAEAAVAEASQVYDDTSEQKKADTAFFDETAVACFEKSEAYKARESARTQELAGIAKAIGMLSTDEARELFAKTIKPGKETGAAASLLQLDQRLDQGEVTERAYKALKGPATKVKSLRLAALAATVREAKVGHFDAVIAKIDEMIQVLKDEGAADIEKRDQCKKEMLEANSTIADLQWQVTCNQAKIDKLQRKMDELEAEKLKTVEDKNELENYMHEITVQREQDNSDFKQEKKNDEKAIKLLTKVRETFESYYKNHSVAMGPVQGAVKGLSLLQQGPNFVRSEFDAPDVEFSGKGNHKNGAKGIIQILAMVTEDLVDEIKADMKEEEQAQLTYEGQMKAAIESHQAAEAKIVTLTDMHARALDEQTDEKESKRQNEALLKDEEDYLAKITPDCEWMYGAFYERADKRTIEMQGLTEAKEFLAGYKAGVATELAQVRKFDDAALGSVRFLGVHA